MDCAFASHIMDFRAVAEELSLEEIHLAGWSTGAAIALMAADNDDRVRSLSFLSGTFSSRSIPGTRYFNNVRVIGANWVRGRRFIGSLHNSLFRPAAMDARDGEVEILGQRVKAEWAEDIGFPFRNPENFFAYCKLATYWDREKCEEMLRGMHPPCLFICGAKDTVSNNAISSWLHGRITNSEYVELAEGTHYMFADQPEKVAHLLSRHIQSTRQPSRPVRQPYQRMDR
jgi:pimeloyl-ACP methyl ester carboxylesterase